jgi:hypothetical protein
MCKEKPVIPVNKVVDKKRMNSKRTKPAKFYNTEAGLSFIQVSVVKSNCRGEFSSNCSHY